MHTSREDVLKDHMRLTQNKLHLDVQDTNSTITSTATCLISCCSVLTCLVNIGSYETAEGEMNINTCLYHSALMLE